MFGGKFAAHEIMQKCFSAGRGNTQKFYFYSLTVVHYRVLIGLNKDSPGGPKIRCRGMPERWCYGLFLTTVTHLGHFLGARCRTGAGSPWGTPGTPKGTPLGRPRDPKRAPLGPPMGPPQDLPGSPQGYPRDRLGNPSGTSQ